MLRKRRPATRRARSGAGIVAAWIAVVYDLLAKIRELALGGDAEAQRITNEVTALQPRVELGDQGAIRRILEIERRSSG
jgi:hypothetical protein